MTLLLEATRFHQISRKHGTVLAIAALYGNRDLVRILISMGEDIGQTVSTGNSAFENLAAGGHEEILQVLLDLGANVNEDTRDLSDGTALQCAVANGHYATVGFLLKSGAKIDMHGKGSSQQRYCFDQSSRILFRSYSAAALAYEAGISAEKMLGENAMHIAANKGHEELVIQLLNSGAAVDLQQAGTLFS